MFYNIDKRVGKNVWLFKKIGNGWDYRLEQDKAWLVESLHEPDETHDDFYFVVSDGNEKREVLWHDTVVVPGNEEDEVLRIEKYLIDNGFDLDDISEERIVGIPLYRISVIWGDWKHDHGWLDSLMGHIGYEAFKEILTEENGSDCYSADHFFVSKNHPKLGLLHEVQKLFS